MNERVLVVLCSAALLSCTDAHDVDAVSPNLRDRDAASDEGGSGGDSDDDDEDREGSSAGRGGTGSGASGSTGGAGSAGRGGAGGAGTAGGGSGQPIFGDVSSCMPCRGAEGSMGALEPCCTADGECGVDIGELNGLGPTCVQQNAPGTESTTCPGYNFGGNFELTTCCGADGFCGVMIMQTAPLGCVDPRLLGDLVTPAEEPDQGGSGFFGGGNDDDEDGPVRCGRNGN